MLTDPRGIFDPDCRIPDPWTTGGIGLTAAFGAITGSRHRTAHDLPPIGTPEHTALMSGSLDLAEIARQDRTPLVGFAPIVLDPAGPSQADLADAAPGAASGADSPSGAVGTPGTLPSRRSLRGRTPAGRGPVPTPRNGIAVPGARPQPPAVAGARSGALCVEEMQASLAAMSGLPVLDDPTPAGELARPFVTESGLADWVVVGDVPPPVSVDVFQKAVRAGLDPERAAALLAAMPDAVLQDVILEAEPEPALPVLLAAPADAADLAVGVPASDAESAADETDPAPSRRTRRELRARERALRSVRGVTARRLAKGGVLAITALGVVSSANPQTLGALGLDNDDLAAARSALDFAAALSPRLTTPPLSPEATARRQQLARERSLRHELADATADEATRAGAIAGDALLDLAFEQDRVMEDRRRAAYAKAVRDVARDPRGYAALLVNDRGWSDTQFQCLDRLWQKESHWNYRAQNRSSGAYGIAQALPGSKMQSVAPDWRTNPMTQIKWGLNYIADRYGTPCGAWAHSQANGWY